MVIQRLKILTGPQEIFTEDSFEAFTIFVLNYTATSTNQPRGSVQLLVVHSSLKNNDRSLIRSDCSAKFTVIDLVLNDRDDTKRAMNLIKME